MICNYSYFLSKLKTVFSKTLIPLSLVLGLTALTPSASFGGLWLYESFSPFTGSGALVSDGAGRIEHIRSTYDTSTEVLTFQTTISRNSNGHLADGFWIIFSGVKDGKPPHAPGETKKNFVIFQGDARSGINTGTSVGTPNLQAFIYDRTPWDNNDLLYLQTFGSSNFSRTDIDSNHRRFSFSIDATNINAAHINNLFPGETTSNYRGTGFKEEFGLWFQPVVQGSGTVYQSPWNDSTATPIMTDFGGYKKSWWDTNMNPPPTTMIPPPTPPTPPVPEPSSLVLAGMAGFSLLAFRQRRFVFKSTK